MKIDRLLSMTIMLLNRRKVTAKDLAEQFEVSVRTIYRDVDTLNQSGIPVISFQGHGGGFCIPDHYKLSRQLLTFSDMVSILSTLKGVNRTLRNKDVDRAIEKISALIPAEEADRYQHHTDSFRIDIRPWGSGEMLEQTLRQVHTAVQSCQSLEFTYTPVQGSSSSRKVEPHTLVFKGFAWYLLAFCTLRKGFRVFRLSRMRDLSVCPDHFTRRSVDPAPYFTPENDTRERIRVMIKFKPSVKIRLEETFGPDLLTYDPDGSITAELRVPDDHWLVSFILGFGDQAEVISPRTLRDRIKKNIAGMKKVYSNLT